MKAPFMLPRIFLPTPLRFLALTIFFFQSTFALAAGKHTADNEESYSLRGTVVNSVTGEAIRGALVEVNLSKKKATLSGADGSFRFEGLPSGQASVSVRKPGFFSEEDVHPLTRRGPRVFATSRDGEPVTLKLVPEGVIFGTIQGDGGEPLEGMQVRLMKKDLSSGRKVKGTQGSVQTDETGTFRFAELLPGSYVLSVSEGPSMAPGIRGRQVTARVKGYSATFFPGAPTEAEATPIKISPGAHIQADLLLASKPLVQIAGTIAGQGSGQRLNMQIMDATGQTLPILGGHNVQSGRFQVQALPPGSYVIIAQGLNASGNLVRTRQQVNASSDVTDLHLRMTPAGNIPLKIQSEMARGTAEEESKRPVGMIWLLSIDGASNDHQVLININPSEGAQEIPGVEPGTYAVDIGPLGKGYVYSARYGSLDLFRENLTIAADESIQPIELVLREDGAKLTGSLTLDGKKTPGAILLFPENAQRLARVIPTDSSGSFEFSQLAPGNYKVLGMDAVDEVEFRDPDFLLKYLPSAQDVTLSPGQNATVQLQIVHIGD